ncbi:cobalt ABC transporter, permease protein CbiQ [Archaeoglobus sulfaticallidus PM70-1]|uniref:Cobalt ABC transporter, permease protein CbiQ n=1 Tax=Archaeoglobus sulfaticallidus PM70-1 TaxID=387631 RepID=N0BDZ0_9EURY|nr:cobalt ECF transporter T component CbiQ [Archaeoglobus sulfaticallidus]AGK61844.1 cobalt ABC transporter, permease protein CbiQ [Archaeoglobus sulfaticallidus PM70-1]
MIELIEKTAKEASAFFNNFFSSERTVYKNGFLQRVDPRIKIAGIFLLIVLTTTTFDVDKLLAVFFVVVLFLILSKIEVMLFLKRVWLFPLFSFIIVMPHMFGYSGINWDGFVYAAVFTFRVLIAVALLSLLILTTPFSDIVSAFRSYRLPETFVSIIVVTYRYIHLTFSELFRIILARESRRFRKMGFSEIWRNGGNAMGVFFIRVFERSERLHLASMARGGYRYKPYVKPYKLGSIEGFFILVISIALWWCI